MNERTLKHLAGALALSPLTPMAAMVAALYFFRLDPQAPLQPGWGHVIRALPLNNLFHTVILLWLYRRKLDLTALFTRDWRRGLIEGLVLAVLIDVAFIALSVPYGRVMRSFLSSGFFGLDAAGLQVAFDVPWLRSTPLFIRPPAVMSVVQVLLEELLLRGLLLELILRETGDGRKAVMGSALFFALLHGQLLMAPWFFLWGCAVGWAYLRTRSLWTPLVIHAFGNLTATYWPVLLVLLRG